MFPVENKEMISRFRIINPYQTGNVRQMTVLQFREIISGQSISTTFSIQKPGLKAKYCLVYGSRNKTNF